MRRDVVSKSNQFNSPGCNETIKRSVKQRESLLNGIEATRLCRGERWEESRWIRKYLGGQEHQGRVMWLQPSGSGQMCPIGGVTRDLGAAKPLALRFLGDFTTDPHSLFGEGHGSSELDRGHVGDELVRRKKNMMCLIAVQRGNKLVAAASEFPLLSRPSSTYSMT